MKALIFVGFVLLAAQVNSLLHLPRLFGVTSCTSGCVADRS